MANSVQLKGLLADTDLDPEEFQIILDNIEDHLAFWEVLYNDSVSTQGDNTPSVTPVLPVTSVSPATPVSLTQLSSIADWLKMSSAPLHPSQSMGGARGFAYRVLNLAIKIFGSPQIRFNKELREYLGETVTAFQQFSEQTAALTSTVETLNDRIRMLEMENKDYRQKNESLFWLVRKLREDLDRLTDETSGDDRD